MPKYGYTKEELFGKYGYTASVLTGPKQRRSSATNKTRGSTQLSHPTQQVAEGSASGWAPRERPERAEARKESHAALFSACDDYDSWASNAPGGGALLDPLPAAAVQGQLNIACDPPDAAGTAAEALGVELGGDLVVVSVAPGGGVGRALAAAPGGGAAGARPPAAWQRPDRGWPEMKLGDDDEGMMLTRVGGGAVHSVADADAAAARCVAARAAAAAARVAPPALTAQFEAVRRLTLAVPAEPGLREWGAPVARPEAGAGAEAEAGEPAGPAPLFADVGDTTAFDLRVAVELGVELSGALKVRRVAEFVGPPDRRRRSPAADAKLEPGMVLRGVGGVRVSEPRQFRAELLAALRAPAPAVPLVVTLEGQTPGERVAQKFFALNGEWRWKGGQCAKMRWYDAMQRFFGPLVDWLEEDEDQLREDYRRAVCVIFAQRLHCAAVDSGAPGRRGLGCEAGERRTVAGRNAAYARQLLADNPDLQKQKTQQQKAQKKKAQKKAGGKKGGRQRRNKNVGQKRKQAKPSPPSSSDSDLPSPHGRAVPRPQRGCKRLCGNDGSERVYHVSGGRMSSHYMDQMIVCGSVGRVHEPGLADEDADDAQVTSSKAKGKQHQRVRRSSSFKALKQATGAESHPRANTEYMHGFVNMDAYGKFTMDYCTARVQEEGMQVAKGRVVVIYSALVQVCAASVALALIVDEAPFPPYGGPFAPFLAVVMAFAGGLLSACCGLAGAVGGGRDDDDPHGEPHEKVLSFFVAGSWWLLSLLTTFCYSEALLLDEIANECGAANPGGGDTLRGAAPPPARGADAAAGAAALRAGASDSGEGCDPRFTRHALLVAACATQLVAVGVGMQFAYATLDACNDMTKLRSKRMMLNYFRHRFYEAKMFMHEHMPSYVSRNLTHLLDDDVFVPDGADDADPESPAVPRDGEQQRESGRGWVRKYPSLRKSSLRRASWWRRRHPHSVVRDAPAPAAAPAAAPTPAPAPAPSATLLANIGKYYKTAGPPGSGALRVAD